MTFHVFTTASAALISIYSLSWLAQPCAAQQQRAPVAVQPTAAGIMQSYSFPARAEDLKPGEYWYRLKKTHGGSYVKNAYDLDAVRYDSHEGVWTRYNPGCRSKRRLAGNETVRLDRLRKEGLRNR